MSKLFVVNVTSEIQTENQDRCFRCHKREKAVFTSEQTFQDLDNWMSGLEGELIEAQVEIAKDQTQTEDNTDF